ncbi:MAG: L-seryl-tRNA(Sec) selenium transferase, partial [Pseudonocardiaceae bacterium]
MDVRQQVPRTDAVRAVPAVVAAARRLGRQRVKRAVRAAQQRVREGALAPAGAVADVLAALPDTATTLRPVLNATGVLLHTNLGRAPLSAAAIEALGTAAGTTDVELDLARGGRGQ